jgi:hypothetical protein
MSEDSSTNLDETNVDAGTCGYDSLCRVFIENKAEVGSAMSS